MYGCDLAFRPHRLAWHPREQVEEELQTLAEYPGAHSNFDVLDANGRVAGVYLFVRDGKLWARGKRGTCVLRDPQDVCELLERDRRVLTLTLVYKEAAP